VSVTELEHFLKYLLPFQFPADNFSMLPIHPSLNENDLKMMGYKLGPQFKQILDYLFAATLDGEIRDRREAELFLQRVESYHKFYR